MFSRNVKRLLKYSVIGSLGVGTALSLQTNNYDVNSIGIVRFSRAASTVFDISLNYKRTIYSDKLDLKSQEYLDLKSKCHTYAAEKMLQLACINKGVYIKVGQHLAALDYLLPKEFVETLRVLHKDAPQNTLEEIYRVIKEDLKKDPNELFKSLDPEPLGTASLAQVHKAILHDGRPVAVKVQHPYVKGNTMVDLKTMEGLVAFVSWIFPEFQFQWLVDETKKNVPQELDFLVEGHNCEKVAALFKRYEWLKVPAIHWDLTTSRVITMDFVEGGQVNDINYIRKAGIDPFEVSNKLGILYSKMIFIDGFVHSDPHPGNILVQKNKNGSCDIILLDHGLYANLSNEFRYEYAQLWLSILNVDRKAMRIHSNKLGIEDDLYVLFTCMITGRTWDTVLAGVDKTKRSQIEREIMQREFGNLLPLITNVLQKVNSQMLLILKTNDLLRGIEYSLGTQFRMNSFQSMSRCCIKSIYTEFLQNATTRMDRVRVTVGQYWALFKFSLYYALLQYEFFRVLCRL